MCESCRSPQELSSEYLFANIGFDTAESEPSKFLVNILQKLRQILKKCNFGKKHVLTGPSSAAGRVVLRRAAPARLRGGLGSALAAQDGGRGLHGLETTYGLRRHPLFLFQKTSATIFENCPGDKKKHAFLQEFCPSLSRIRRIVNVRQQKTTDSATF